jgi:anti-anti-sigma regulatory factor
MLRIERSTVGKHVVFALSGRIEAEDVAELQKLFQSEGKDHNLVLDLKDVRLVNRDAVRFLADCEADGIRLRNCPAYIREWIARERDGSNTRQGEAPS